MEQVAKTPVKVNAAGFLASGDAAGDARAVLDGQCRFADTVSAHRDS
jgi:hypothetical protein